jgi:hypothetical protein
LYRWVIIQGENAMIRKTLLCVAAVAALAFGSLALAAPAQAAQWKAYAVNQQGNVWYSYNFDTEWSAKDSAISHCEDRWAYDCRQSSSVPMNWTLAATYCVNSDGDWYYSTGGSRYGKRGAISASVDNANDNSAYWFEQGDCRLVASR